VAYLGWRRPVRKWDWGTGGVPFDELMLGPTGVRRRSLPSHRSGGWEPAGALSIAVLCLSRRVYAVDADTGVREAGRRI
jgi:hypothetical protein